MAERSGIEMLEEILFKISQLESQISGIDKNIKSLLNTSKNGAIKNKPEISVAQPNTGPVSGFKNFSFQPEQTEPIIMVKGKLKLSSGNSTIPISGVSVTIYDSFDKVVKKTKTNRAGQWMSQLKPGKYVALFEGEANGKKLLPQNKNFIVPQTLPAGQTEFEVI